MSMRILIEDSLGHVCKLLRMLNIKCFLLEGDIRMKDVSFATYGNILFVGRNKFIIKKCKEWDINVFYVNTTDKYKILKTLVKNYGLVIDIKKDRKYCSLCGSFLIKKRVSCLSSQEIEEYKIPKSVVKYHKYVFLCEKCKKSFWYGTHWNHLVNTLKRYELL